MKGHRQGYNKQETLKRMRQAGSRTAALQKGHGWPCKLSASPANVRCRTTHAAHEDIREDTKCIFPDRDALVGVSRQAWVDARVLCWVDCCNFLVQPYLVWHKSE